MHASFLIIGGGLSGLAAAIRLARFHPNVLLLEKHSRLGGLNSYYYRNNRLIETGLHAITNFTCRENKKDPLNKLLRQLKISRDEIGIREQKKSRIQFGDDAFLHFSNNFDFLKDEIATQFRKETDNFLRLVQFLDQADPFVPAPYVSARTTLKKYLKDPLLIDMLLCPVLYYGSCWKNDIDLNQFIILFRSIFQEGLFRPEGTIKDLLDLLRNRYLDFGGTIKLNTGVSEIHHDEARVTGILLESGELLTCDYLISTAGIDETKKLLGLAPVETSQGRLSFMENIFFIDEYTCSRLPTDLTIVFYNKSKNFSFEKPNEAVDFSSGVVCMPHNFLGNENPGEPLEIRTTHLANFDFWNTLSTDREAYAALKIEKQLESCRAVAPLIGDFENDIVFQDAFTPVTIKRFTGKIDGAVYGSSAKAHSGCIGFDNLFLAGTDQGFLGIVGSMLSGVAMVNRNILTKL